MPPAMNTMVANSTLTVAVRAAHQAELDEQEADHRGREHLEEALDPQVHDPPAPVLDHRQVRVLAPHQPRAVEQPDGDGRQEQQADDRRRFVACASAPATARGRPAPATACRPMNRNICQKRPMSMYSQPWWPNQKLCARPSFCITANHWPANAPTTMTTQADEQEVDAQPLELRLVPRDRRPDVQARARATRWRSTAPRAACASCASARRAALRTARSRRRSGPRPGSARWSRRAGSARGTARPRARSTWRSRFIDGVGTRPRSGSRAAAAAPRRLSLPCQTALCQASSADAGDHEQHAEHRPDERRRGRRVADQRLVRPVARVAHRARPAAR